MNSSPVYNHPTRPHQQVRFFHHQTGTGYGGLTFAFAPASDKGTGVYEIAVAICNPADRYCRRDGRNFAYNRFMNGHTIHLPIPKGVLGYPAIHETLSQIGWVTERRRG